MSRNRQTDNSVLHLLKVLRVGGASPAGTRCDRRSSNAPSLPDAFRLVECPVDAKVDAALAVLLFRGQGGGELRQGESQGRMPCMAEFAENHKAYCRSAA